MGLPDLGKILMVLKLVQLSKGFDDFEMKFIVFEMGLAYVGKSFKDFENGLANLDKEFDGFTMGFGFLN